MVPEIHLHILASGSKGNAYLVEGPQGMVLVDDGLSRKELLRRADELDLDCDRIRALVVTHEHSDHVKGLPVWCRHWEGRLLASPGTIAARDKLADLPWEPLVPGQVTEVASMTLTTFPTSHDVAQPMGMTFRTGADAVGICTDTGVVTPEAAQALTGMRILALESNHDPVMLRNGEYPRFLKERVGGDHGHLSNDQAAAILPSLVTAETTTVVAMHLSEDNNRPSLAVRALAASVGAEKVDDTFTEARTPDGRLTIMAAAQWRPMTVW